MVYPSYFSMLRNGVKPFETTYGISHRRIPQYTDFEQAKVSDTFAIFGQPIQEGLVDVCWINRAVLRTVFYSVHFGPVMGDESRSPSCEMPAYGMERMSTALSETVTSR